MDPETFLFILLTGIIVIALSYSLDRLWAAAMPVRILYLFIRFPGIVLHECAHVTGCLLTGARIRNVVLFSQNGGSVTYTRPLLPYIGDVIISTAPLFLLPLALSFITGIFSAWLGCIFPVFPPLVSADVLLDLMNAIAGTFSDNLITHFNGWFLLYLYLTTSLVLSIAPSTQDWKNAACRECISGFCRGAGFLERDSRGNNPSRDPDPDARVRVCPRDRVRDCCACRIAAAPCLVPVPALVLKKSGDCINVSLTSRSLVVPPLRQPCPHWGLMALLDSSALPKKTRCR